MQWFRHFGLTFCFPDLLDEFHHHIPCFICGIDPQITYPLDYSCHTNLYIRGTISRRNVVRNSHLVLFDMIDLAGIMGNNCLYFVIIHVTDVEYMSESLKKVPELVLVKSTRQNSREARLLK